MTRCRSMSRSAVGARRVLIALVALGWSSAASAQVINEWVASITGPDDHEYLEVYGAANTNYGQLTLLQIEGDIDSTSGSPGVIDSVHPVGTTDGAGYWVTSFLTDQLDNGTKTFLLVSDFTGTAGDDLDANDDGTFETTPWTAIVDDVAVDDQTNAGDQTYSQVILTPGFDGDSFTPGGASRLPNGQDTDSIGDWKRNDYTGAGLPGYTGTVWYNEAYNTPGAVNRGTDLVVRTPIVSEFVASHVGADTAEFIEVFGTSKTDYSTWSILVLEGDSGENPGRVDGVYPIGTVDVAGFWWTGTLPADSLENGSLTLLVARDVTALVGDDLDANDDGVFDVTPWSEVSDDVSVDDGGAGDVAYSTAVLDGTLGGGGTTPGGASRYPYFQDSDQATDWMRNDFAGEGLLTGVTGTTTPGEAYNTPGRVTLVTLTDYYAPVDTSTAAAARASIHAVIDDHIRYPYSSSTDTDTWDILEAVQVDPNDSNKIIDVYRNASYTKGSGYNREHTWAKTYGFGTDSDDNYPFTDTHHLYLSDSGYNSDRGSLPFDTCDASCTEDPTVFNASNGQGGGSGTYPGNSNWYDGQGFEIWGFRRGDVARSVLYMAIRYEGGTHGATGFSEPDLELIDGPLTQGQPYMGQLSVILQWAAEDPVDDAERARNAYISTFQGNRNPFVDHPEWIPCVFQGICNGVTPTPTQTATPGPSPTPTWTATFGPSPTPTRTATPTPTLPPGSGCSSDLFFSEYVEGSGFNKALEIYNDTGTAVDLAAGLYDIARYANGSSTVTDTVALTGTVADGDVYVVAHSDAGIDPALSGAADQRADLQFNGDDALALRKNGEILDVIGQIGVDPGSEWGTGMTSTRDNTLRRKATIHAGDPDGSDPFDPAVEWEGYANGTFDGVGAHAAASCATATPTPTATATATPSPSATATSIGQVPLQRRGSLLVLLIGLGLAVGGMGLRRRSL